MMEASRWSVIFLIAVSVTTLSLANAQKTYEECTDATGQCQQIAADALKDESATDQQKCQKVTESLNCLISAECIPDTYFRLFYLQAENELMNRNVTCDLESQFYPQISGSADPCLQRLRNCVFDYADSLTQMAETGNQINMGPALCQRLTEYIGCRLENNCASKSELEQIVSFEERRMNVNCVVPQLTDSYTFEECGIATSQCRTLDDEAQGNDICPATLAAMDCTVNLQCSNDVLLRLIKLQAIDGLQQQGVACDVDSVFAQVESTANTCEAALRECVNDYVDTLRAKNSQNPTVQELCNELNTFIACEYAADSCQLSQMELEKLAEEEVKRMRIGSCIITTFLPDSMATAQECAAAANQCQMIAANTLSNPSATNQEKCQKVIDSLNCLSSEACVTDVEFRIIYLMAVKMLTELGLSCDIESQFYPPITGSADPCLQKTRDCLINYTDTLMERAAAGSQMNLGYALCQDLTEYVGCRLEDSCANSSVLEPMVSREEMRMRVDCVVPQLTDSYTFEECGIATGQCQSLDDGAQGDDICPATLAALNCTVNLQCNKDVVLRLIKLDSIKRLQESEVTCDVESIFAQVESTSTSCEAALRKCVDDYVDILLVKDEQNATKEELCVELNKFIECEKEADSCEMTKMEFQELVDEEVKRMRIVPCIISAFLEDVKATAQDCTAGTEECQMIAINAINAWNTLAATEQQTCQKLAESLQCMKSLECVDDVQFRILTVNADTMAANLSLSCDISSHFFPPTSGSAHSCLLSAQDCVVDYTDKVMHRVATGTDVRENLCHDLNEYVGCRLKDNCAGKTEMRKVVANEEERMLIGSCSIDALNHGVKTATTLHVTSMIILCLVTMILKQFI